MREEEQTLLLEIASRRNADVDDAKGLRVLAASFIEMLPEGIHVIVTESIAFTIQGTPKAYWLWP